MTDHSQITEFVGTVIGGTIGLMISGINSSLVSLMKLGEYRSIGIFGGHTAVGLQVITVDEAVKAVDVKLTSMGASRGSRGGTGHGALFYIGANGVSDARRVIEVALGQLSRQFGEVCINDVGHLSFSYTARAGQCCAKTLRAVGGKAFGVMCCGSTVIGCLVSDLAVKFTPVTVISYHHPLDNCFANEVALRLIEESAAVRQALRTAIRAGKRLLGSLGEGPHSLGNPWIQKLLRRSKRLPWLIMWPCL